MKIKKVRMALQSLLHKVDNFPYCSEFRIVKRAKIRHDHQRCVRVQGIRHEFQNSYIVSACVLRDFWRREERGYSDRVGVTLIDTSQPSLMRAASIKLCSS